MKICEHARVVVVNRREFRSRRIAPRGYLVVVRCLGCGFHDYRQPPKEDS